MKVKDAVDKLMNLVDDEGLNDVMVDAFILNVLKTSVDNHCSDYLRNSFYEWYIKVVEEIGDMEVGDVK